MKVTFTGEAITGFDPKLDRSIQIPAGKYNTVNAKSPSGKIQWQVIADGPYKGFGMSRVSWESNGATFSDGT